MSVTPSSGRRGTAPRRYTSADEAEAIRRLWAFLGGLETTSIKLIGTAGLTTGHILTINSNGYLASTDSPTGDLFFTGTDFNVHTDAIALLSDAGITIFADDDIVLKQRLISGIAALVGIDPPAVASGSLGKVDLTAQVANIATTALTNTPPAAFYEVEVYLLCTTADAAAGTLTVTIGWTDNVGATTSTPITALVLTATGRTTGRQLVRVASGNITYAVTVTGIFGSSAYAVYVRVISLG